MDEVIGRIQCELSPPEELEAAKTWVQMRAVTRLNTPVGAAAELARGYAERGAWREALAEIDRIGSVSAEQVRTAAKKYLLPKSRLVVTLSAGGRR
jgi:predicted Zn-dependent peptidase